MPTLITIPQEIVDEISRFLPTRDVSAAARTCHSLSFRLAPSLYLRAGSPVRGVPAIHHAVRENELSLAKYLLSHEPSLAQVKYMGSYPLHTAVSPPSSPEMIKLLLDAGTDVNILDNNSATPLRRFCSYPFREVSHLQLLLDRGADVNIPDREGLYSLPIVVTSHSYDLAIVLLAHGANPSSLNRHGYPPILLASRSHRGGPLLKALLHAGADMEHRADNQQTALLLATQNGCHENVALLLEAGADLEAVDRNGDSALGLACMDLHREIARTLLKAGAFCDVRNKRGNTPVWTAMVLRQLDLVEEMLKVRECWKEGDGLFRQRLQAAMDKDRHAVMKLLQEEIDIRYSRDTVPDLGSID